MQKKLVFISIGLILAINLVTAFSYLKLNGHLGLLGAVVALDTSDSNLLCQDTEGNKGYALQGGNVIYFQDTSEVVICLDRTSGQTNVKVIGRPGEVPQVVNISQTTKNNLFTKYSTSLNQPPFTCTDDPLIAKPADFASLAAKCAKQ